ncbi:MAG: polysaccharide biosynthesis PFTS motif protein [Gemmatimonadetes bacterium]|nr:polysaccharide biosynthesis PFTS motif protein [Gemmatimonadota bacterium]
MRHLLRRRRTRLLRSILAMRRGRVYDVLDALALTERMRLKTGGAAVAVLVPETYRRQAEACVTQEAYFLLRSRDSHAAIRRVRAGVDRGLSVPLPPEWRSTFRAAGIPIDGLGCALRLWLYSGRRLLRGCTAGLLLIARSCRLPSPHTPPDLVILQMPMNALPPEKPEVEPLYDFVSCVRRSLGLGPSADIWLVAKVPAPRRRKDGILLTPQPLPQLGSVGQTIVAFGHWLWLSTIVVLLWLFGSWRAGLLLRHALELAYARRLPETAFARHYSFSVSGWVIRPLWTYRAAEAGARCTIVYYSANSMIFSAEEPPRTAHGSGEALATWDHYIVPSDDLRRSLEEQHRRPVDYTVGPLLGVEDNGQPCRLKRPERTVAVFDVFVFSAAVLSQLIHVPTYYSLKNTAAFFDDIVACAEILDLEIARKPKRDFPPGSHPAYLRAFEAWALHPRVISVPPAIAAVRLATASAATISIPFTTPSTYGAALGKPSIFYDPTGVMAAHTPTFHGVPVVSGRAALLAWLRETFDQVERQKTT